MDFYTYIRNESEFDLSYRIQDATYLGMVLERYKPQLAQWTEKYPDFSLKVESTGITLRSGEREHITTFLQIFGGNWKKSLEDYEKDKIRYDQEVPPIFEGRTNLVLSVRSATPPSSCKIEEYEEEIPAQKVTKKRIICPKSEDIIPLTTTEQELMKEDFSTCTHVSLTEDNCCAICGKDFKSAIVE